MTINARSHLPSGASVRLARPHTLRGVSITGLLAGLTASLFALVLVLLAIGASPAHAELAEFEGVKVGLQPRNATAVVHGEVTGSFHNTGGRAVVHGANIYVVYWDHFDDYFEAWQRIVNTFFQGVGQESNQLNNIFAVYGQYDDQTNEPAFDKFTFRGAYTDSVKYPTTGNCVNPGELGSRA